MVVGLMLVMVSSMASMNPEQVHIALTENAGEMRVTFAIVPAATSAVNAVVKCNVTGGTSQSYGATNHTYIDGGFDGTIFEAVITDLEDAKAYTYTPFINGIAGNTFTFVYQPNAESINFIAYGDTGVKNSQPTAKFASDMAIAGKIDLIVNVGDTSYADDYPAATNAKYFDQHFNEIERYAARAPFMTCPGNHEDQFKFAGYLNRLKMPVMAGSGELSRFYYSFNYGPVHFLVYSSEHTFAEGTEQYEFIQKDLAAASTPAARAKQPWIVMWTHHPMYCSDLVTWEDRCLDNAAQYRGQIEKMMVAANVDLHLSGHNHQYERSFPVNGCNSNYTADCQVDKNYNEPKKTVYIVTGAGGNMEGADPTWVAQSKVPFRAAHDEGLHTGIGRVFVNKTMLKWDFVYTGSRDIPHLNQSDYTDAGKVVDSFTITKSPMV